MQESNGATAAENTAQALEWIRKMQMHLGQGQVEVVVEMLQGWRSRLDLKGIPDEIIRATERSFGIARNALQHPIAVDTAIGALNQASQRFLPGHTQDA